MSEQRRYLHVLALSYAQKAGLQREKDVNFSLLQICQEKIKNLKKQLTSVENSDRIPFVAAENGS